MFCKEAGGEGWYGTYAEIAFNVSREQPYITLPREIARLEALNVCDEPVTVQNQFFEYLEFGNGRMPKSNPGASDMGGLIAHTRNSAPTFLEMTAAPQYIVAYSTNAQDATLRAFVQGLDQNSEQIYSQDSGNNVQGLFLNLDVMGTQTGITLNQITGIQKDITVGPVRFYQRDPLTGDEILLLTMQPGETTASYRRYYLNDLPCRCCAAPGTCDQIQVTAIAKLEVIPVRVDTDYLLIQNLQAIIEECQSIRYSEMDSIAAKQMEDKHHLSAVRRLNGELTHYLGKEQLAVGFNPFGSAKLQKQKIGSLI